LDNVALSEEEYEGTFAGKTVVLKNSLVIKPCYIGENVQLTNSVVGPYVSIGSGSKISGSVITNSIIQNNSTVETACIDNSMIGNYVQYKGKARDLSMGDFSTEI
jgi:glucose-1-phosphate thymidylyltransferase